MPPAETTIDDRSTASTLASLRRMYSRAKSAKSSMASRWQRTYQALFETGTSLSPRIQPMVIQRPRDNEIMPIVSSLVGWLEDQNPPIFVHPAQYDPTSPFYHQVEQLANDLEALLLTNLKQTRYTAQREIVYSDGLTFGTGIYKVSWDDSANNFNGEAIVRRIDPFAFFPDPLAKDMRSLTWAIEDRLVYRSEVRDLYGEKAADGAIRSDATTRPKQGGDYGEQPPMAPLAGGIIPPGSMVPQPTIWPDTAEAAPGENMDQDVVTLHECWYIEDGEWYQAIWSGQTLIAPPIPVTDIYEHGRPPYCRFVTWDIGEFWGPSLVEFLLDIQTAFDDNLFHIGRNLRLAGNPVLLEPMQAGTSRTSLKFNPGARIPVQGSNNIWPKWLEPPQLPPYAFQLLTFWVQAMERTAGLQGVLRGQGAQHRQSQGSTDRASESGLVRVRSMLGNHEITTRDLGDLLASTITQFATDPQILAVLGPGGMASTLALTSKHFYRSKVEGPLSEAQDVPLRFAIMVEPGSAMPTSKQSKEDMIVKLKQLNVVDDKAVLDVLEIPHRDEIQKRKLMMAMAGLQAQSPARQRAR